MGALESLEFAKYHGAGNDYVLLDGLRTPRVLDLAPRLASEMSDRHTGVGSDGLIVLGPSGAAADLRMHMWNADGSRGAVCGNGLRCVAGYAHALGVPATTIESDVRIHPVDREKFDAHGAMVEVRVGMGSIEIDGSFEIRGADDGRPLRVVHGSTGNPHAVVFVPADPESFDLAAIAASVRRTGPFEDGVNVELAGVMGTADGGSRILQRTHERGSGETLACGSGATFVAAVALAENFCAGPEVEIDLRGGRLVVDRLDDGSFALRGPVARAFDGQYAPSRTR